MKRHTCLICLVLVIFSAASGHAQNNSIKRPILFADFPTAIDISTEQLNQLFSSKEGDHVSVLLANNFRLAGPVTSKLIKYINLQTMVIKLPAFNNTLFSLSRQTGPDNNDLYVGRILNPLYADGFELAASRDGNYQFIKIDIEKILVNCAQ